MGFCALQRATDTKYVWYHLVVVKIIFRSFISRISDSIVNVIEDFFVHGLCAREDLIWCRFPSLEHSINEIVIQIYIASLHILTFIKTERWQHSVLNLVESGFVWRQSYLFVDIFQYQPDFSNNRSCDPPSWIIRSPLSLVIFCMLWKPGYQSIFWNPSIFGC